MGGTVGPCALIVDHHQRDNKIRVHNASSRASIGPQVLRKECYGETDSKSSSSSAMTNNGWTVDSNEALVLSLGEWQGVARPTR